MRILPFDNTKSSISAKELVDQISKKVPAQVQIDMLRNTFPNGTVRGDLFTLGSTSGEQGKSLKIDQSEHEKKPNRKLYSIENLDVDCRFIKVKVKNQKVCPEWHTGSGGKTWLFMDEINIL